MNPLGSARGRGLARCLAMGLGLLAAAAPAFAVQPRKTDNLSQKEFFKPELYISVSHEELGKVLDAMPNKAAWQSFLASRAGAVHVYIDPRSGAATNIIAATPLLPGSGVGNRVTLESLGRQLGRSVEQVTPEVVAAAFMRHVRAHQDVLGIDISQLGAVRATMVRPDLWQIHVPQVRNGIPVRDGRLAGSISHGNLVVIGTETWGNVAIDTLAAIPAEAALAAGFGYAEGPTAEDTILGKPALEIIPIAPQDLQQGEGYAGPVGGGYQHRLVWTFLFQRLPDDARYEVIVDALTGDVLSFQDKNQYAEVKGGVYPVTSNEICPIPGRCGTMQPNYPMPFTNTGLAAPNDFTNSAGFYNWPGGTATTTLNGRFVRIADVCGPVSASSGAQGLIDMGGTTGQHDCVTPGTGGAGNTASSRSAFFEVNKIAEMARGYLPANTWLTQQLTANVNINSTCNGFWNGSTINFYRSGGGCRNTGELAGVFDHEWGHGIDDNDANGTISSSGEGYADIAAIYRYQDSCVGHGFWWTLDNGCGMTPDGTGFNADEAQVGAQHCSTDCSGVRDADWAKHIPNTPDTALGYVCNSCGGGGGPCGRQVHCSGATQRQAAWDLVARDLVGPPFNLDSQTRFIIGNKLFYQGSGNIGLWYACTCGGTSNACGVTNGYMQWITADDDDGNLNNGTPHMTAIHAAFDRHGIACATPAPTNFGCPAGPSVAPTVNASPGNNQVALSWNAVAGATRYWVFRSEGQAGCDYGKALIAEVTTLNYVDTEVANGRPYSYNVMAAGTSSGCFSPASTCVTATPVSAPGPTNLVATSTAPNQITLVWTAAPTAASYKVYRATGACPQTAYALLAANVPAPTYVDNTVSGGLTYSYVVTFVDSIGAESGFSNCDDAVATGGCALPPTFAGVTSVTNPGTTSCALDVSWGAGSPTCPGTTLTYNVYRSTTAGTPPSAATLVQSCVSGLTFQDTTVLSGTRYYYVVRAEDSSTLGSGPCNSGVEETNVVERSGIPSGPTTTVTDDVESGGANWSTTGGTGTNPWTIVTTQSHSPTHSWFWPDPDVVTLQPLTRTSPVSFLAGGTWSWWHRLDTESTFDGYVAEYSLDGGTTWSDILLGQGTVPANPNRFTLNGYNSTLNTGFSNPLPGRRAWSGVIAAFQEVRVDMTDFAGRDVTVRWRAGSDDSVSQVGAWIDDITFATAGTCTTVPTEAAAPDGLVVDFAGNRVYQPNETVIVSPTWRNTGAGALTLTGALTNHTGPAGPTYSIPDDTASYGSISAGATASCGTNCYSVANTAATRPATHWDSTALETVTPTSTTKTWTLHVGDSFSDVSASSPFYRFIETILHKGVTGGCSATAYCPGASTTREQMAVFVLVSREGTGYTPPACVAGSEQFTDVPASSPFCRWIEELFNRGVVGGCGTGIYCPTNPATREQMAVFVLRTLDPTLDPPACVAGSEQFADVPASSPFCRWIEELANRGVVTGCGGGNYCPTANVSREQMAVFLAATFGLTLYGL